MDMTIDDAQSFIIEHLTNPPTYNFYSRSQDFGYNLYLENVIREHSNKNQSMSGQRPLVDREFNSLSSKLMPIFMDAAWNLCQMGILRPGTAGHGSEPGRNGGGYSVTTFGRIWLSEKNNTITADPFRLTQLFNQFQSLYGKNYFRRAQEAMRCFQSGIYLACCVMCGAAAESILLEAAFQLEDPEKVLEKYLARNGRRDIENMVFGKTKKI